MEAVCASKSSLGDIIYYGISRAMKNFFLVRKAFLCSRAMEIKQVLVDINTSPTKNCGTRNS